MNVLFGVGRDRFSGMRYLKTTEAATLLNVSPSTLRAWERRFGFPQPRRSPGGTRSYTHGEVVALRAALEGGVSISSAVSRARAAVAADTDSLVRALLGYDRERADRAIETTLALRSVERSVEEVLLPSLEAIVRRKGADSAAWAFSARWAADWLRRAKRLAPPLVSRLSIVLGDASGGELDLDAPYVRALELFCVRAGVKVLRLSARTVSGIGDAASVHRPDLVVLAGGSVDDDTMTRWTYAIGRSVGPVPLVLYRPARTGAYDPVLPPAPGEAQLRVVELADAAAARAMVRQLVA
jgi:MerR family transcriptional regulator, light-induced transcriptional regulator